MNIHFFVFTTFSEGPANISLWKDGAPLFGGSGYAGLSEMALHALGGILRHAPALLAFTNPTTNSYKRLVFAVCKAYLYKP